MSTAIATQQTPFAPQGLEQAWTLSEQLSGSELIPTTLRGKPSNVMLILMTGHELGLQPTQALRLIHVVQGRPVLSAELLHALVRRHPEVCETFQLVESTDARATYETRRRGEGAVRMSWTIEQAKNAGLAGKDNWKAHPAAMLRARCAAALVRAVYPDLILGMVVEDEADEIAGRSQSTFAPPPPRPPAAVVDATFTEEKAAGGVPDEIEQRVAQLREAIEAAGTTEALSALVETLKALPEAARAPLRTAYNDRFKALNAAQAGHGA